MKYLSIGLSYIFEFLIIISFCNRMMEKKFKYTNILLFTFPLYVLAFALYFIFESVLLNNIITFLIYFFTMFIGYREKTMKQIIYTAYLSIINYVSEAVLAFFMFSKYTTITQFDTSYDTRILLISLGAKMLNFILVQLFILLLKHREFNENKKLLPLFIYPIISLYYNSEICVLTGKYNFAKSDLKKYIFVSVMIAVMCIVIFIYYELLNEQDKKLKEIEKEQQFVELNDSYMQVLESQNNEMHMIVHDVKNHYAAIASMDDANKIHDYISSIANDIQKYQIVKLTNNKMLDLLLSKYKVECSANGIEFNTEVKTANLNYIDDSDLSIVICNLLDNAVQAASKSNAKQISLSLRRVNNFDVLTVTNSCDTEPQSANGKIATSKKDKTSHGYGMRLIEKYARKNNAEYEWHYENDKNIFVSTLIFKR